MKMPITNVVSIYQFQRTGNTEQYQASSTYENINACISPTGTDIQSSYGDVASYQLFEVFIYDTTLILGSADKIVTENGAEYIIDGKPYVVNGPFLQYIRCLCRQVA